MLREFMQRDQRTLTSSYDFKAVAEKYMTKALDLRDDKKLDWFFDEWVYGTAIPTYTFSWTAQRDSAGVQAHLRVRQSDVPRGFGMYVPVLIKFAEGEALIRMLVHGDTTEATIRLPAEPVAMELNPLESVLADVKTEGWHQ
jgi:hypothetical protein